MSEQALAIFRETVNNRHSTRGYLDQPVPQDLLNQVFELAQQSPSNCNTQPWQVYVVSGSIRDVLAKRLLESIMTGSFSMDFEYQGNYQGVYKERQHAAARELYAAMDIARDDKVGRNEAFMQNFNFFGAPHVAFLFLPEPFGIREAADLGMYAQTLMLSLTAHGLASCPQTALSFDANTVREVLAVDPANKLLFGISFGYEDKANKANACRIARASLDQSIHFISE